MVDLQNRKKKGATLNCIVGGLNSAPFSFPQHFEDNNIPYALLLEIKYMYHVAKCSPNFEQATQIAPGCFQGPVSSSNTR